MVVASFGALALSGCGAEHSGAIDVGYDGECVVEIGLRRSATQRDLEAMSRRVESIPHVDRIQVLSRAGELKRFREALRRAGYAGKAYDRFMARARRDAGRTLLVKADDDRHVPEIVRSLHMVPATVQMVAERDSCDRAAKAS